MPTKEDRMEADVSARVDSILGAAYTSGFGQSAEPLSQLAIETIQHLNTIQDNLDRSLKRATEKTLNLKMTQ